MPDVNVPKIKQVNIRIDGRNVIVEQNGQKYLELPYDAAKLIAQAIRVQALKIEETINAQEIILDQALLMRKGIPLGLTSNPVMQKEAGKEAAWNSDLRRYIPSIKSMEAFGTPTIIQHKPKEN